MMKGGGTKYGRSYGAESVENVASVRSKRSSSGTNDTKGSLSYVIGVSLEGTRDRHP